MIRNAHPHMRYRRFGKTNLQISVFTLGTMRFLHGWDKPADELPQDSLENSYEVIQTALDNGVNLIETAKGYVKSERLIGRALPRLTQKRDDYYLMSKAKPDADPEAMRRYVLESIENLGVEKLDLFAFHGINCERDFDNTFRPGGALDILNEMRREGLVDHIGFSTHGPPQLILRAIATGAFDFVNLHYYYFRRMNAGAIHLANALDMGVFIISPNDKGGHLYAAPEPLLQQTAPLHPVTFNERFILANPQIHTMSLGLSEPAHMDLHLKTLQTEGDAPFWSAAERSIDRRMQEAAAESALFACGHCVNCLPCPERINIPEVLRMAHLAQVHHMLPFGQTRYGEMDPNGVWFPGAAANICTRCNECLPRCPQNLNIPERLFAAHDQLFHADKQSNQPN
ncbi:aldo/keto reductase [Magnetofaba australis]|uniref:Putative aldo/keto reductase n=1 Tax=Magnetofaba australis IT-1 TaxID=1434232 RepID=A0A1Y2K0A7_9PROT|nr:aldo/keto reductase [Magnetofaba australis]OSM01473.1 putative aldo/keto reductase [Magnetofaba australis IT-1]